MKLEFSDFLKADDVEQGDVLKILDAGELSESQFTDDDGKKKMQLNFLVNFKGETKKLSINKTSQRALAESWGTETSEWVGKEAKISFLRSPAGKRFILLTPKEN